MTKLPATLKAAEARLFAEGMAVDLKSEKVSIFGQDLSLFDKADGRRFVRSLMKWSAEHPTNVMTIVDYARQGWGVADEALREMIIERLDRGEQLPTYLAAYNMEITRSGGVKGMPAQKREATVLRDIAIAVMVMLVSERFDLKPTRNPASARNPSACDIVATSLNMSEPAVTAIWKRLKNSIA